MKEGGCQVRGWEVASHEVHGPIKGGGVWKGGGPKECSWPISLVNPACGLGASLTIPTAHAVSPRALFAIAIPPCREPAAAPLVERLPRPGPPARLPLRTCLSFSRWDLSLLRRKLSVPNGGMDSSWHMDTSCTLCVCSCVCVCVCVGGWVF
jgi:hypothetical protein